MTAYVVESAALDAQGVRRGTFRHYVATEARALEECAKAPGRTYRQVTEAEMPERAVEAMRQAMG